MLTRKKTLRDSDHQHSLQAVNELPPETVADKLIENDWGEISEEEKRDRLEALERDQALDEIREAEELEKMLNSDWLYMAEEWMTPPENLKMEEGLLISRVKYEDGYFEVDEDDDLYNWAIGPEER